MNATGTLNLLDHARNYCPAAPFVFTSTNKVYGDRPNSLPLLEFGTRYDLPPDHERYDGIDETTSIDQCLHSVFGASKVAADIMTQEYGKYFGMPTVCFRGGCLTGENHSGAKQHGFLSYLMKCAVTGQSYTVMGYGGKQVRDNIHSADLVRMFEAFIENPKVGEVYNAGGGRERSCSLLEAIALAEDITGNKMSLSYQDESRVGDHKWWITSLDKFRSHYPRWHQEFTLKEILTRMYTTNRDRWCALA